MFVIGKNINFCALFLQDGCISGQKKNGSLHIFVAIWPGFSSKEVIRQWPTAFEDRRSVHSFGTHSSNWQSYNQKILIYSRKPHQKSLSLNYVYMSKAWTTQHTLNMVSQFSANLMQNSNMKFKYRKYLTESCAHPSTNYIQDSWLQSCPLISSWIWISYLNFVLVHKS